MRSVDAGSDVCIGVVLLCVLTSTELLFLAWSLNSVTDKTILFSPKAFTLNKIIFQFQLLDLNVIFK